MDYGVVSTYNMLPAMLGDPRTKYYLVSANGSWYEDQGLVYMPGLFVPAHDVLEAMDEVYGKYKTVNVYQCQPGVHEEHGLVVDLKLVRQRRKGR